MTLRLACDLDGTVADMDAALQREAERLFGPDVDLRRTAMPPPSEEVPPASAADEFPSEAAPLSPRPLTRGEIRTLWGHVRQIKNFWLSLDETEPGIVSRLADVAAARRWEVIFLTQRPSTAGLTSQLQSQKWLRRLGFPLPSVFVMQGSRGKVAEALALNLVIDDRAENCLDVAADSRAMPVLVWRAGPATAPSLAAQFGFQVVSTTGEALDRLEAGALTLLDPAVRQRRQPRVSST